MRVVPAGDQGPRAGLCQKVGIDGHGTLGIIHGSQHLIGVRQSSIGIGGVVIGHLPAVAGGHVGDHGDDHRGVLGTLLHGHGAVLDGQEHPDRHHHGRGHA